MFRQRLGLIAFAFVFIICMPMSLAFAAGDTEEAKVIAATTQEQTDEETTAEDSEEDVDVESVVCNDPHAQALLHDELKADEEADKVYEHQLGDVLTLILAQLKENAVEIQSLRQENKEMAQKIEEMKKKIDEATKEKKYTPSKPLDKETQILMYA